MIKAKNLNFSYDKDKTFINNLNVEIEKGKVTTILGPNGSGKSTLLSIFAGLNKPSSGDVIIKGKFIKSLKQKELAQEIATVHQQNTVPSDITVKELVYYGRIPHKKYFQGNSNEDEEIVEWAIKRTGLEKLKDKSVMSMSGGERQRLAMARALYSDRDVLVLDEPTAALDALAEDKMYQEFNEMVKGKTAIFISHRLSSTRFCDKIVMFEDGRIIEEGTHDELMKNGGKYSDMFQIQAQYYKSEKEGVTC